jgi:hypothetical protein
MPRVAAPTGQGAKGNYTRPETKIKNSFPKYSKADSAKGKKYNEQKKNPPLT